MVTPSIKVLIILFGGNHPVTAHILLAMSVIFHSLSVLTQITWVANSSWGDCITFHQRPENYSKTSHVLTLFDIGAWWSPQNVFVHCVETLESRKLKLCDF